MRSRHLVRKLSTDEMGVYQMDFGLFISFARIASDCLLTGN
jgi:hypothetical protein